MSELSEIKPNLVDSITRGHNLKLSRLTCRSRIRHDYFSQRIVEYWNGLPSDVVNVSSVNSFKGRLDKHWKEFMFSLELPKRTVTYCYWRRPTDRQKAIWPIKPQKMVNGKTLPKTHYGRIIALYGHYCIASRLLLMPTPNSLTGNFNAQRAVEPLAQENPSGSLSVLLSVSLGLVVVAWTNSQAVARIATALPHSRLSSK